MAARSIFEGIHGTPSIRWCVDTIRILNPINTRWVEASDLDVVDYAPSKDAKNGPRLPPRLHALVDVAYVVSAYFVTTGQIRAGESVKYHEDMFLRRARRRQSFRTPFLGIRECPAEVHFLDDMPDPPSRLGSVCPVVDLGWMTYETAKGKSHTKYFKPQAIDGLVRVPAPDWDGLAA